MVPGFSMHCCQEKILTGKSGNLEECRNTFVRPVSLIKQRELDHNYSSVNLRLSSSVNKYEQTTTSLNPTAAEVAQ